MGTVRILLFLLVLRNFWVETVKKATIPVQDESGDLRDRPKNNTQPINQA